ncbi:hypothetical protein ACO2Q8_15560 [Larkinella sp. VNQ87]|uniref:hypothetical protein n=1 Tax=Larkinella sp. VNQ87 TaxID=3400921 RepID=UPI003BFD6ED9
MRNNQQPDSIASFQHLLPEWSQAADEVYQNYHFLTLALGRSDCLPIPEEALKKLTDLRDLLVRTLVELLQDLPPATHRLSNENHESINRFNEHTATLKAVNQQTDTLFQELILEYPSLRDWFESLTDE